MAVACIAACTSDLDARLADAAMREDTGEIRRLVNLGADANGKIHDGWTPFTIAAREGKLKSVSLLLDLSFDPNGEKQGDSTPILWAARRGHGAVVGALLAGGADPCARFPDGRSARESAEAMGYRDVASMLPKCPR